MVATTAPIAVATPRGNAGRLMQIATLIVAWPLGIFALSLQPVPAALILAGLALTLWLILRDDSAGPLLDTPLVARDLAACLVAALALCILGGQGHFAYSTWDWISRDAVLADLVTQGGLPFYQLDGVDYVMRAPIGMYLMPALVGRWAGIVAAHYALVLQNAILLSAILYLSSRLARGAKVSMLVGLIFFSPLDIIPRFALDVLGARESGTFVLSPLTMFWNPMVPVWGNIPQLFWAPNHALPGWLFAVSFLYHLRGELALARLGLLFVTALLWSPLAMIGALPFMAYAVIDALRTRSPARDDLMAATAGAFCIPLLVYLQADAAQLDREWLVGKPVFWICYALMLASTPQAWLLLADRKQLPGWVRPVVTIATITIALMTMYRFGSRAGDNDMALRCTLVPMFLLGVVFADYMTATVNRSKLKAAIATLAFTIGALTGAMEIRRSLTDQAYRINDCNLLTAMSKEAPGFIPVNYIARVDHVPHGLVVDHGGRAQVEPRLCWPGFTRYNE